MHRICRVRPEGFYLVGDAQTEIEGPIRREQIFGRVVSVRRKGRRIGPGNFWWEFFEHVWIRVIPLRRGMTQSLRPVPEVCFGSRAGGGKE